MRALGEAMPDREAILFRIRPDDGPWAEMRLAAYFLCVAVFSMSIEIARAEPPAKPALRAIAQPALRSELLDMAHNDQKARMGGLRALGKGRTKPDDSKDRRHLDEENKRLLALDEKNRQRLVQIIDEHGWPGRSLVGRHGADAAWLIAQHADSDVAFQRRCLALIESAPKGEVESKHVVYLTDRVFVNEGKPQRFGTQLGENFRPRPIEDAANVDKRRAEVGLPPLSEYLRAAKEAYEKMTSGEIQPGYTDRKESD